MKFFCFHLMPYLHLPLDYDARHKSAWVTLPNAYYDPALGAELYDRYLDELEYGATLGFDGICVNEHHQTAYGLMPAPNVIAGALARRTASVKIAIVGRALPLLANPLSVAEEFAMLDNITRGRIIAGFVRGIGAEYHSTGVNPTESRERFYEAHDLILRAWTEPGPFAFHGKYYQFNYVNVWPRTFQQPRPPIWIPSQGSQETAEWAAASSRRYTYLLSQTPAPQLAKMMQMYRDAAERSGYDPEPGQLGWSITTYVAETDAAAVREARAHIEAFMNKFIQMPIEMLLPPGYQSLASMRSISKAKAMLFKRTRTIESMIEEGTLLCGSPATVREQLAAHQDRSGFDLLLPMLQFGTLPSELTRKNMELFAREVIPFLRNRVPQRTMAHVV
jgi:alkanesulfonate monooxygenase SsuD/methylene tetrahydromethanopterin reductase-like flavin-dependent oxidoreductase (luciferase family)